ncbi:hypothetical protein SDC9_145148 [bioreactor metagenome]|uniref:Uncharacterized protein n=1 Tax=bioreactor metagenome TaxID=1076179 RepID=A0A645E7V8_9ZZZZ
MDFQLIGAVFQFVAFSDRFTRQLARFTHRHKANAQTQRYRRAKQKAASFGTDNFGDACIFVTLNQQFDAECVSFRIFQ